MKMLNGIANITHGKVMDVMDPRAHNIMNWKASNILE